MNVDSIIHEEAFTHSFVLRHKPQILLNSINTKHTTCRDLLLRVSVGDNLMARVVFALHNQS